MKYFFMRHAQSLATLNANIFADRVPSEIPLTTDGRQHAQMAGLAIKQHYDKNPGRKLRIIHNNATRVLETAMEIAAILGDHVSRLDYDIRAEEFDHGAFNSLTVKQMMDAYPEIYAKVYYDGDEQEKLLESYVTPMPNGESKEDLYNKTAALLHDLLETNTEIEDILFVSHVFNCRALEAIVTGKDVLWLSRLFNKMGRADVRTVEINDGIVSEAMDFFKAAPRTMDVFAKNVTKRIAIIGGGAAGTAILVNLISKMPSRSEIVVFDQTDSFGPGYCYDISLPPSLLLNRVVGDMEQLAMPTNSASSATYNFMQWIADNKISILAEYNKWKNQFPDAIELLTKTLNNLNAQSIVPRSLYGRYLIACFSAHIEFGKKRGISVVKVSAKVTNLDDKSVSWNFGDSPQTIATDYIVMATGHWQKPKPIDYSNVAGYYNDPMTLAFAPNDMPKIKNKTVLIRGTGLSAIDGAIMSLELGAKKVTMFSRNGKLRSIKGPWKQVPLRFITLENLDRMAIEADPEQPYFRLQHIFKLVSEELKLAGIIIDWQEALNPKDPLNAAFAELEHCKSGKEFLWRSVFESSFPIHQEIYKRLHPDDKTIFLTKWLSSFMSFNSTIPLESLERFAKYIDAGRFEVISGDIIIQYDRGCAQFQGKFVNKPSVSAVTADVLINATGQDRKANYLPLIEKMHASGGLLINSFGGIKITERHNLINAKGEPIANIYVLGALASGDILNYSGLDILDEISKVITNEIALKMQQPQNSILTAFGLAMNASQALTVGEIKKSNTLLPSNTL